MPQSEPQSIEGKCALITGAARRIGASIATLLHAEGARVAIHYRGSAAEAGALAATLNEQRPDSARTFAAELGESGQPEAMLDAVIGWSGGLDILVNNASSFYPTPLGTITEADWLDLMGSNLKGPLFLSQAAVPHLRASRGTIVNIVDIHATRPLREHPVYCPAKAGLAMLTRSLAKELAPDIRVNGVSPGAIAWPENGMSEKVKDNITADIPLGQSGDPLDIARCVLFLARDATYTTGQIVAIDGGRSVGW